MLSRRSATLGLIGTLMLVGISCGEELPDDGANVRVIVQNVGSSPHVVEVKLRVSEYGSTVTVEANARINATGQAEVDLEFYVDGILQDLYVPQIVVADVDSGCVGCPADTRGSGSYTWPGMTPGDYEITVPVYWEYLPNASIDVSLTFEAGPGAEWAYVMPAEQIVGYDLLVAVKPVNLEGPVADLALTVEFDAASRVDLLDPDADGVYLNYDSLVAPGPAGDHIMTITLTNTVSAMVNTITHTYPTVSP